MPQRIDYKELSQFLDVDKIGQSGAICEITATAEECRVLAKRFGIQEVVSLKANLKLRRAREGAIRLDGNIDAEVVQNCVVSLQPVQARIRESFAIVFSEAAARGTGEIEIAYDLDDAPEPIVNGRIDLGEAVAQHLALALDPYPRAPGAEIPAAYAGDGAGTVDQEQNLGTAPDLLSSVNPFSMLGKLKD